MDEIELVVKIPKEEYEMIVNSEDCGLHTLTRVIANGTPLPKGHGKLIDADDIDNHIIGHVDTRSCPTIIEADKEDGGNDG